MHDAGGLKGRETEVSETCFHSGDHQSVQNCAPKPTPHDPAPVPPSVTTELTLGWWPNSSSGQSLVSGRPVQTNSHDARDADVLGARANPLIHFLSNATDAQTADEQPVLGHHLVGSRAQGDEALLRRAGVLYAEGQE